MANRYSENLPEVVPDSSPQPLTYAEAYERRGLDQGDQKYTVIYDLNTPKIATSVPTEGDGTTPTSPAPAYRAALAGTDGAPSAAGTISPDVEDIGKSEKALTGSGERKILGLKKRTFFIILIAVVLVIAAAIGGGVGGFHAGKQKASASDSADVAEEAASPPATTEPGAAHESSVAGSSDDETSDDGSEDDDSTNDDLSTDDTDDNESSDDESNADGSSTAGSGAAKPSATSSKASPSPTPPKSGGGGGGDSDDDKDDDEEEEEPEDDDDDKPKPGFNFRGWKNANFKGSATDMIVTTGFLDLPFDVTSYKWHPEGTDCCVTMCQGKKKDVGWRCTNFEREESSASFGRIFIGCGAEASQESSRCS